MSRCDELKCHAIRLFARDGFGMVSIRDLARAAGLQPGSIYGWYDSKGALLLELITDHVQGALSHWLRSAGRRNADPLKRLSAFVDAHLEFMLTCYPRSIVVESDRRSLDDSGRQSTGQLARAYEDELVGVLEQGHAAGLLFVLDAKSTAVAMLAMLTALGHRELQSTAPLVKRLFSHARHASMFMAGAECACPAIPLATLGRPPYRRGGRPAGAD